MLSEHCVIRNLPWKIMIMQRQTQTNDRNTKSVGYFLQVWMVMVMVTEFLVTPKFGVLLRIRSN